MTFNTGVPVSDANPLPVSFTSGGGAATVADGANVVEGSTTDAVVAAGAAGTISAKLRRLTTDIAAFLLQLPASLGAKTGALSLSVVPNTDTAFPVTGTVADGVADAGNTVKVGGVYSSSLPTLTTGQRSKLQLTVGGHLIVGGGIRTSWADGYANATTIGTFSIDGAQCLLMVGGSLYNGTSWDRVKKPGSVSRILSSAATTNAAFAKASAGDVFKIVGNNTVASKRYLKLYNKASAPTVGTDTPVLTFVIPASAPFAIDFGAVGHYFSTGIAYAITGAAADADTTAISAGDIECFNLTYA